MTWCGWDRRTSNLAEERRVDPLVKRVRFFSGVNANGALVVLVFHAGNGDEGNRELVGHQGVDGELGGAAGAVLAQGFNGLVDGDHGR